MALKVEIRSRETIKPLPSTPAHLKLHNLTVLDQKTPSVYIPICLFYPFQGRDTSRTHCGDNNVLADALKSSLSKTLSLYYPLAGRYRDASTIECNDEGVEFVEAYVVDGGDMSGALQRPDEDRLVALLPCPPRGRRVDSEGRLVLLAVQLNLFECGGVAIGVCVWHGVADACTLACFLRAWSTIHTSRAGSVVEPVVVDCSSIFPPITINATPTVASSSTTTTTPPPDTKIKRFLFEGSQIAALRSGIQSCWQQQQQQRPSRVEAVSALIWAAVIAIARDKKNEQHHHHHAGMLVNVRPRMIPPLPDQAMGNLVPLPMSVKWPISYMNTKRVAEEEEEEEEENEVRAQLAAKLRESVAMVNDENMRKVFGRKVEEGPIIGDCAVVYSDLVRRFVEEHWRKNAIGFSSWCRFPFYETDFGWGKPAWVGYFNMMDNVALLIDGKDGEGIEAWVSLSVEDMCKFQNDPAVRRYSTGFRS